MVDDDHWKLTAMARELASHPEIEVVAAVDQDQAQLWPLDRWQDVDLAVVDVFDENAPSEVGTDVYSGIALLDRLRELPVDTLAITPHCQHPLVQLRIYQSGADWLYHRWEVNDPESLIAVVLEPDDDHAPQRPDQEELWQHGAHRAHTNRAVARYLRSPFAGRIRSETELDELGLPRRAVTQFRVEIAETGFTGTELLSTATRVHKAPRWPDVRDYLLTLLGRRSTPPTEVDRDDDLPTHDNAP